MPSSHKILVVDDEKLICTGFQRELAAAGYAVDTAFSGPEAIEKAKANTYDIVYTDLVMPSMNGATLCEHIKKLFPTTMVVLVSGAPAEILKHQLPFWAAGGRDEILRKPIAPGVLLEVTNRLIKDLQENPALKIAVTSYVQEFHRKITLMEDYINRKGREPFIQSEIDATQTLLNDLPDITEAQRRHFKSELARLTKLPRYSGDTRPNPN